MQSKFSSNKTHSKRGRGVGGSCNYLGLTLETQRLLEYTLQVLRSPAFTWEQSQPQHPNCITCFAQNQLALEQFRSPPTTEEARRLEQMHLQHEFLRSAIAKKDSDLLGFVPCMSFYVVLCPTIPFPYLSLSAHSCPCFVRAVVSKAINCLHYHTLSYQLYSLKGCGLIPKNAQLPSNRPQLSPNKDHKTPLRGTGNFRRQISTTMYCYSNSNPKGCGLISKLRPAYKGSPASYVAGPCLLRRRLRDLPPASSPATGASQTSS